MRLFTEISSDQQTKKKYLLNMEMKFDEDLYKYHNNKKELKLKTSLVLDPFVLFFTFANNQIIRRIFIVIEQSILHRFVNGWHVD